jgi:hypothetical protein
MELQLGRVGIQSNPGIGGNATYFDARGNNLSGGNSSGFVSTAITITEGLGIYYLKGGVFQLNFQTPIESFLVSSATSWAFALSVRLVGATAGTADGECHINVWFSEA